MDAGTADVRARDLVRTHLTVRVRVRGLRGLMFRLRCAIAVARLAAWIAGGARFDLDIQTE